MPITPQPRSSDETANSLQSAFRAQGHLVSRIELQRKGEKGPFVPFLDFNVDHEPMSVTGDEQVEKVVEYIRADLVEHSGSMHKVLAFTQGKQGGEDKLFSIQIGELPPTTEEGRKTRESNAIIETNSMLRGIMKDMHEQHIAGMRQNVEIVKSTQVMMEAFPKNLEGNSAFYTAMTEKWRMDHEHQERILEHDSNKEKWQNAIKLAELALQYVMGSEGVQGTPGKPPLVGKMHAFYTSITPEERAQLIPIIGEDTLQIFEAAGNAETDDQAKAIFSKLRDVWGDKDPKVILFQMQGILGPQRTMLLVQVLQSL